ncbi:MAG: tetratricopeptide repeat protein [Bacteroidota bacterium]
MFKKKFSVPVLVSAAMLLSVPAAFAQGNATAQKYLDVEQFGKAGAEYKRAVTSDPSAKNQYGLGYYYLRINQPDSAKTAFEQGLKKDPNYALNTVGLGAVQVLKSNKVAAKAEFDKALAASKSKNAEVAYAIGEAWTIYTTKDAPEAVKNLELATRLDPKNPEYFLTLGDAYLIMNDGSKASENYELKALPLNKNLAKTYIRQGKLMERARNYQEAARKYQEGLSKDSGYYPGYRELGELYLLAGKNALALQNYERYIRSSDKNPTSMFMYAEFLLRNKKYPEALAVLKDLEAGNKNPQIYRGFAYAQFETGDYAAGLASMEKLFATFDTTSLSAKEKARDQAYYGKLLMKSGKDVPGGIARLRRAALIDTNEAVTIHKDLAKAMMEAKDYKTAAEEYEAIANSSKGTVFDRYQQGTSLFYAKDYAKADTVIGTAIKDLPDPATAIYLKGQIATKLDPEDRTGKAKAWYERYVQTVTNSGKPEDIEKNKTKLVGAYLYMGYYYLKLKDKKSADDMYNKALALDPANATAKQGLTIDPNAKPAPAAKPAAAPAKKSGK